MRKEEIYALQFCKYIFKKFLKSKPKKILDVGCGDGRYIKAFENLGCTVYGIDIKPQNNKIIKLDITKDRFPFKDNEFDLVFGRAVIEHIINPDNFLQESSRVLKTNGAMLILTPEFNKCVKNFWSDYTHIHPYTKKSLKQALDKWISKYHH